MAKTYPERQSLVARRMQQGDGSTCIAVAEADLILERLPTGHLPGAPLLPEAAQGAVECWHTWTGDDFATQYGL